MENFSLYINGVLRTVCVPPQWTLLRVLRETLGLTGAKNGCSSGDCGACRVILDCKEVNDCKVPIKDAAGHRVEPIEGERTAAPHTAGVYRLRSRPVRLLHAGNGDERQGTAGQDAAPQ